MKVSELIKELEYCKESYGDIQVSISIHTSTLGIGEENIFGSDDIYIGYDRYDDHEEINIRSFPY